MVFLFAHVPRMYRFAHWPALAMQLPLATILSGIGLATLGNVQLVTLGDLFNYPREFVELPSGMFNYPRGYVQLLWGVCSTTLGSMFNYPGEYVQIPVKPLVIGRLGAKLGAKLGPTWGQLRNFEGHQPLPDSHRSTWEFYRNTYRNTWRSVTLRATNPYLTAIGILGNL